MLTSKTARYARARVPAPFPVHRWADYVPDLVVMPRTTEEVAEVVRIANLHRIPVVPRDGGTGLTDGARPERRGIVVDVKRMTQIEEIDLDNRTCTVGTGINMLKLNEVLGRPRADLPGRPGVLSVFAGGRPDRHQWLVAGREPLRAHPRPGALVRLRPTDRTRSSRSATVAGARCRRAPAATSSSTCSWVTRARSASRLAPR